MSTTVVLADDHLVVREGVKMVLEREKLAVVGEASDGLEAIALAEQLRPDVVVLDLAMPTLNGLSAVDGIKKVSPRSKLILLTMYTDEHHVLQALRAGVKGCVSKAQAPEHLLEAITEVCAGGVYLSPSVSGAVVQAYLSKNELPRDPLTGRERQVLQLVAEGKTTKEIAVILSVTVKTAESHRSKLMEKLDIHSTAGLVRYAIRHGFVVA
jgi:two-component system response regulator NreC